MPSTTLSTSTTLTIAKVPYLNSEPFFRNLNAGTARLAEASPRELGAQTAAGVMAGGLLPVVDYFRLEDRLQRVGPFGIAVRGRARSVMLFSRLPIRQLGGATIAVTEETSTSAVLLRLLLEQRYMITPKAYQRGQDPSADALLLIGDAALQFQQTNARYSYEIDLGFEWWLWQHLPFTFAVWALRNEVSVEQKKSLESALSRSLGVNSRELNAIAAEQAGRLGLPAAQLEQYLAGFVYRLSQPEEEGIAQFRSLVHEFNLL